MQVSSESLSLVYLQESQLLTALQPPLWQTHSAWTKGMLPHPEPMATPICSNLDEMPHHRLQDRSSSPLSSYAALICASHYMLYTWNISFTSHKNPARYKMLSPCCRWANWGLPRWNNLPVATQLIRDRAGLSLRLPGFKGFESWICCLCYF